MTLHGEIDLLTAVPLSARLDALTAGPRPDLVLDLRPVSFIDCAGLGVLCRARNRALSQDGRVRLVSDSIPVLRVLRAAGLSGVFEVHPHLPDSLNGTPASKPRLELPRGAAGQVGRPTDVLSFERGRPVAVPWGPAVLQTARVVSGARQS